MARRRVYGQQTFQRNGKHLFLSLIADKCIMAAVVIQPIMNRSLAIAQY